MTSMTTSAPALSMEELEQHRRELTGFCYRMLGSAPKPRTPSRRPWSGRGARPTVSRVEQPPLLAVPDRHQRLHRHGPEPTAAGRPVDLGPAARPTPRTCRRAVRGPLDHPDRRRPRDRPRRRSRPGGFGAGDDPAGVRRRPAATTGPQRAALILCEVLAWPAETAELLESSVASVNSALQRAEPRSRRRRPGAGAAGVLPEGAARRYVDAFERYDMEHSPRCCTTTPCRPCRRTPCGSRESATCSRGRSARGRVRGSGLLAGLGQRLSRVRAVPGESRRWPRSLGPAGARVAG